MIAALIVSTLLVVHGPALNSFDFVGKWSSTRVPPKGEAPIVAASFTIAKTTDSRMTIAFAGSATPHPAIFFGNEQGGILMVRRETETGAKQMIVLRSLDADKLQFEIYVEYGEQSRSNFQYSEVFKRLR